MPSVSLSLYKKLKTLLFLSISVFLISVISIKSSFAFEELSTNNTNISIPYSTLDAVIDGELDDEIWKNARVIELSLVNSPLNNTPAPVKTTARIIENGEYLYVSFLAEDPDPSTIQASLGDRDSKWSDELVGIRFDTLGTHRLNYVFMVNPYGVQNDEIYNEITDSNNELWDGIWDSYGKITPFGYQVEIAIPYRILNFDQNIENKQWPFELARIYRDENTLRLSHVPLDRNNACWLCQYPNAEGFKDAKIGKNLTITPAIVATKSEQRDIYDPNDDWHSENDIEPSLDIRWGITPSNTLNATLNPDFSTVEADAGQLNVNETFSLFYDEKRQFFLENTEYFSSTINLVYTRNIADPDYGLKLTGSESGHSYGVFFTEDTQTNFILPGNLSSTLASLNESSQNTALRYRYDYDDAFSIGVTSTLRNSDSYHNYVAGIDSKYKFDESNTLRAQILTSETEYPEELFLDYCYGDCDEPPINPCEFGYCDFTEQVLRSQQEGSFTDQAYIIDFQNKTEYWAVSADYSRYGKNFRADLGYVPKSDFTEASTDLTRFFYNDDGGFWTTAELDAGWTIQHNVNNELIARELEVGFEIDGPKLSYFELNYTLADRVGLRHDDSSLAIDNNTTRFDEKLWYLYGLVRPTNTTFLSLTAEFGDKIDYDNNRLGDYYEVVGNVEWFITPHLEVDVFQTVSKMDADGDWVFKANLTDFRLIYQFDVQSSLKLTMIYSDIEYNPNNNPYSFYTEKERDLSTQLIYSYKVNPQTVFYLGYSDASYQDDVIGSLKREQSTFFTKVSYAWMP